MVDTEVFTCNKCSECCKNFGKLKTNNAKKIGFVGDIEFSLTNPSFILLEWEKNKLEIEYKKAGVELSPHTVLYDLKNKQSIITTYSMDVENCPHLSEKDNKCKIYNIRPYTCRAFPLLSNIWFARTPPKLDIRLSICKNDFSSEEEFKDVIITRPELHSIMRNLHKRYKDVFEARMFMDFYIATVDGYFNNWVKEGKIKPAMKEHKKIKSKINKSQFIGLSSLIEKHYGLTPEAHIKMVEDNCRKMLESIISNQD